MPPVAVLEALSAKSAASDATIDAALEAALLHSGYSPLQAAYLKLGAFRLLCDLAVHTKDARRACLALNVIANYAGHRASTSPLLA